MWAQSVSGHNFSHIGESLRIKETQRNVEPRDEVKYSPDHSFQHMTPYVPQQVLLFVLFVSCFIRDLFFSNKLA